MCVCCLCVWCLSACVCVCVWVYVSVSVCVCVPVMSACVVCVCRYVCLCVCVCIFCLQMSLWVSIYDLSNQHVPYRLVQSVPCTFVLSATCFESTISSLFSPFHSSPISFLFITWIMINTPSTHNIYCLCTTSNNTRVTCSSARSGHPSSSWWSAIRMERWLNSTRIWEFIRNSMEQIIDTNMQTNSSIMI